MKKTLLIALAFTASSLGFSQTATNFNCNDCNNVNHDLFTELNAGKVIVIAWVMPCASCISPSLTAYNVVQSYSTSNPGQVLMYMVDDYANTNCTSLNSWATSNNMPNTTRFSNATISMSDYGSAGMPKIIVVGGTSHTVYFNQNNSAAGNASAIQAAINSALASLSSVNNLEPGLSQVALSPVPAAANASLSYSLGSSSDVKIELYNMLGEKMSTLAETRLGAGSYKQDIDCAVLRNGIYFVKLTAGGTERTLRLNVSH